MDFLTKKELIGLKGDLKASEIALNAEKEEFSKKLINKYGKEMDAVFNEKGNQNNEKHDNVSEKIPKKKCFLKKLFSF